MIKKFFCFTLMALIISSCGYQEAQRKKKWEEQLRKVEEEREQERQDSIHQARLDSLSLIAWGDLKFGMTEKEAIKTQTLKGCEISYKSLIIGGSISDGGHYGNSIHFSFEFQRAFEDAFNLKQNICSFYAAFDESELTDIYIESHKYYASYIDDLVDDCIVFIRNFKEKIGEPTYLKDGVSISDFNEGESFTLARFEVGEKTVSIRMEEDYSGGEYGYSIYISNSNFPKKKHIPTEEELKRQKAVQDKKESIQNLSF